MEWTQDECVCGVGRGRGGLTTEMRWRHSDQALSPALVAQSENLYERPIHVHRYVQQMGRRRSRDRDMTFLKHTLSQGRSRTGRIPSPTLTPLLHICSVKQTNKSFLSTNYVPGTVLGPGEPGLLLVLVDPSEGTDVKQVW